MLHYNVDAVIAELMLAHGDLLQTHVVLEHLTEVDGHRLADCLVHWVLDVELLQGVVAGVQNA